MLRYNSYFETRLKWQDTVDLALNLCPPSFSSCPERYPLSSSLIVGVNLSWLQFL